MDTEEHQSSSKETSDNTSSFTCEQFKTDNIKNDSRTHCGYTACHPKWLQKFATVKWFLASMSIYVLLQSLLVSGYISSVITTIEKRYDLRSSESGLIVSSFDIGSLLVVVFISYLGGKGHRPRWIGIGTVFVSLGALLFASPHFLSSPYAPGEVTNSGNAHEYLCLTNSSFQNKTLENQPCNSQTASSFYIFLFMTSNMIIGIGSTPIYTLGTTFIYDNSPKEDSSLYIDIPSYYPKNVAITAFANIRERFDGRTIMYLMGAVGPALGYLLGGYLLSFYVDIGVTGIDSDDPRFIGAWWSGYILCAGLTLLTSIPILAFPRKLRKLIFSTDSSSSICNTEPISNVTVAEEDLENGNEKVDIMDASLSFGNSIKDLPRAFISLLCNPIFLCITATATLEFSIVTAFMTFVPKYIQNQFNVAPTQASILTGVVLIPSAGGGILFGGYIVKRLRLNITGCAKVALLSNIAALFLFISVFFISCPSLTVMGISSETCNYCDCKSSTYDPVCFSNVTYYSPCKAGCSSLKSYSNGSHTSPIIYTNCSCSGTTEDGISGECDRDCMRYFIPFMIGLFLVTMATASAQTPALMVTLRCVKSDERPFAMGLQFVFYRALAYIPSPIYFGSAIDRACMIWRGSSDECDDQSGACLVYDSDKFRYIYFGLASFLKVISFFFVLLSWYLCRQECMKQRTKTVRITALQSKKKYRQKETEVHHEEIEYGSLYRESQQHRRKEYSDSNLHEIKSSDSEGSLNSADSQRPLITDPNPSASTKVLYKTNR